MVEGNTMSLLLSQASSYTESSSSKKNPRMQSTFANIQREQEYKKKTISPAFEEHNKEQVTREKVVQDILKGTSTMKQTEEDSGLADFSPSIFTNNTPQRFDLNVTNGPIDTSSSYTPNPGSQQQQPQKMRSSNYSDSYSPTPYYKGLGSNPSSSSAKSPPHHNSQLMEKLNYMIHLLEEQQKEPTQNILEEFMLYGLLGVFMIYLVDSFSKAGKYIR